MCETDLLHSLSTCRDGLERVKVSPSASVGELKQTIASQLGVPEQDMTLSQNPALLTTKDDVGFCPGMIERFELVGMNR